MNTSARLSRVSVLLLSAIVAAGGAGCGGKQPEFALAQSSSTSDGRIVPDDTEIIDEDPSGVVTARDRFTIGTRTGKADLIWVIDNSGSMTNEAAQVRRNFQAFINSVSSFADFRLSLVSSKGSSGEDVELTPEAIAAGHSQIDLWVNSKNALTIAASLLCSEDSTAASSIAPDTYNICNTTLKHAVDRDFENMPELLAKRGALHGFYRADAMRVLVVVTDDDALGVTDKNFKSMVSPHVGAPFPYLFAFRGRSPASCSIAEDGLAYDALAASTGGSTFDICETDWSSHFAKLTEKVVQIANGSYVLSAANVLGVQSVRVDGVLLSPSAYKLVGSELVISVSMLPVGAKSLEVVYQYQK
jgi:hypothetical protein